MSSDHKIQINEALFRILEPLAHLCIRQQVSSSELEEMIRRSFVSAALARKGDDEPELTHTRIAFLTGLNRKEVGRLKGLLDEDSVKIPPTGAQKIINGWLSDSDFLDSDGKPRDLLIRNKKDGVEHGSFAALVAKYGNDLRYLGILQEMIINRFIEYVDDNCVALVNHAFIPLENDLDKINMLAKSVSDLFNTALHNIEPDNEKRIQRQVQYSRIDVEFVDELKEFISSNSQDLLLTLNAELAKKKKLSKHRDTDHQKTIGFGVYYVEKDIDKE